MSKWRVWRHPLSGKWIVNDPDRRLVQAPGNTWREALAHADRMARTVEVVLPRYSLTPRNRRGAYWGARKRGHDYAVFRVKDFAESQVIHVAFDDLRPLAAALLSLAEREEQQ